MKKKNLIILVILIFIVSVFVRYWPVFHKGYSYELGAVDLILARNLSFANKYSFEDEKNIVLSSFLVKEKGIPAAVSNQLTPIIYSKIFNAFGFNPKLSLYVSIFIYALTTVLLFLLVFKLFNLKLALIVAGVDIFMPFVLAGAIWSGFYEWAMLFFIIGILIYLWKEKPSIWRLLFGGLFFGLAALARNAFLISFVLFVVYDFYSNFIYKKDWKLFRLWLWPAIKRVFMFILPVVLLWGGFMIHDYSGGRTNPYLNQAERAYNVHLFTDPYTYHFEEKAFINEIKDTAQGDEVNALISYGYLNSWRTKIKMHFVSLKHYITGFVRQPLMGGSLIIFFLILGAIFLYKKNKQFLILSVLWIVLLFLVLIGLRTSNEDHFLEIRFPLVLLISLGVFWTLDWLKQAIKDKKTYILLAGAILLVLLFHFIQSDKWMFHENYLYTGTEERVDLVDVIKKDAVNIGVNDVLAVPQDPFFLNYYTNYNYIYFNPKTIEKLLDENKLQWAFEQFGVTHVAGFGELLNGEILDATKAKVIDLEE
jgi:hypothetical protein